MLPVPARGAFPAVLQLTRGAIVKKARFCAWGPGCLATYSRMVGERYNSRPDGLGQGLARVVALASRYPRYACLWLD
jgi:hypothetical protein